MKEENLPKFPESPIPDSITKSQVYVIENSDIQNRNDIEELIKLMYDNPHATFEFYFQAGNPYISNAIEEKQIYSDTVEAYYYKHPKFERDYIKINKETTKYDWEKQVAETTPMFFRRILTLTEKQQRKMDKEEDLTISKEKMSLYDKIAKHPITTAIFILGSIASIIALVYMFF